MKKTDKKTTVLRIFEKSDGEKAYVLEKDGFYESDIPSALTGSCGHCAK